MYDGPLAEPVIYTILFKYSRSCAILSVAKRFVTIFYFFTQFWIVGNKYFKNTYQDAFLLSLRSYITSYSLCKLMISRNHYWFLSGPDKQRLNA